MTEKESKNSLGVLMDAMNRELGLKKPLLEAINQQVKNPLLDMLGANKNNQVFTSSAEADKFLSELRNEWTH